MSLAGQVAVVTGGGRGVGRELALALGDAGMAVAVVARSNDEVERVAGELARGHAVAADVADQVAVEAAAAEIERELGPPDLLVNNAGTHSKPAPPWEADPGEWWLDLETSLLGTFLWSRAVVPGMLARGRGRVVNVSSYAGTRPSPYQSGYAAAKAAVLSFTESLASALSDTPVRAFAITPGFVDTELTRELRGSEAGRRWLPELASASEVPPERVRALVMRLASGEADALHGRFLHALDDLDDLLRRADELERDDLYVMRLQR
jgi:NAD(P)-dependent dehydrogenase (short-subunit alcohol dehydrogenase family)